LWKKEVQVVLRYKTNNFIDVEVGSGVDNVWWFTGLYGEPKWQDKQLTWQYLRNLYAQADLPWLVMGDINEILYQFEKEGGNPRPQHFMQAFKDALDDCNLADFGYIGHKFTWHRGKIRERLDRALTNEAWSMKFGDAVLENMEYSHSDHRPILMEFNKDDMDERNGPTVLRFEAKWLKEAHFRQVVEDSWEQAGLGSQRTSLAGKLAFVHDQLHKWDKSILQKSKKAIRKAQRDLEKVSRVPLTDENIAKQRIIAKEIEDMLKREEIHWAQRSRINCLQHGDKNTSYFHHFANETEKKYDKEIER
jgi:mannosylglycoprotein endo-beta-mannosidase